MEAEIAELKARLSGGDGGGVVQGGGNDTACEMVDDAKNKAVDLNVEDDVHVTVAQSTIAVNDKQVSLDGYFISLIFHRKIRFLTA